MFLKVFPRECLKGFKVCIRACHKGCMCPRARNPEPTFPSMGIQLLFLQSPRLGFEKAHVITMAYG